MKMAKYVIKRILLMLFVLFVITTICFMLVRMLPREMPTDKVQKALIEARWKALGYEEPLLTQFGIYLRNIFTEGDFGESWYIQFRKPAMELLTSRLLPTVLVNLYSLLFSIPVGILLGIYAAIKKNRWQDHVISTAVIVFVSVPSYVYAFLVMFILCFKLDIFPLNVLPLASVEPVGWIAGLCQNVFGMEAAKADEVARWFSVGTLEKPGMLISMIPAILAMSFGEIAGLCRFTRAELTETLTSDYMLLARTKGLTRAQATARHALKNAMVPILPMIIGSFVSILGGSMIIEEIFSIPGVGRLYIQSVMLYDYDVFMVDCIFYTAIGLLAGIVVDLSYGFIDPRIRMGEK